MNSIALNGGRTDLFTPYRPRIPQSAPTGTDRHKATRGDFVASHSAGTAQALAATPLAPVAGAPAKGNGLLVSELNPWVAAYLSDCELRLYSPRTIEVRAGFIRNLLWFLENRNYAFCGPTELRQFFHYLMHGHVEAGGRFGNPSLTRAVRPITVHDYYICLRGLFHWCVAQGALPVSPFESIGKPQVWQETKQPLSPTDLEGLMQTARVSAFPSRDVAILAFLLDTGCRASELISLRLGDIDLENRRCRVLGKGNKLRSLYFGDTTAAALHAYFADRFPEANSPSSAPHADDTQPLFLSSRGKKAFTRSGLLQLTTRLRRKSGLRDSCSPHALRRSFAVQTLKNGANVFSVQMMLGHSDLQMTRRYCALAQADVEAQHRLFGPLDRLQTPKAAIPA